MSLRLTCDERAELERVRKLTEDQAEELLLWRTYGRPKPPKTQDFWGCQFGLARAEALILAELVNAAPEVVGREQLLMATAPTWLDAAREPDPKIIDVYLCEIRKRLALHGFSSAISTYRRVGYSLSSAVAAQIRPKPMEKAA